ncbi:hypothetical protein TVAG_266420 [Trichomonas vaginalis G3]|uniref:NTF2 domain-containing protein n=1 Tax=Trichomonas vaginalis (strain ATCC PRA-98 / G3) TaxID=412133 RepID=A2DQJ5_TRIV3|nr:NTF2-like family [Trichomonas vaginalis G3]EAY17279.1 hypothetical protein TVAG_266420 [Trichomonas vaginalis G3]KAI5523271.1 NTF2-like family [Trichomonas vaginalis G3]|eukprot:XP_001329502.1 hypothetical protein [Trichomonas vaginalis G3]
MQSELIAAAKEFIVIFYNFVVTNKRDIYKFYDSNAIIVHSDHEQPIKVSEINENREIFEPNTQLNVINYSVVPNGDAVNITCNIQIKTPSGTKLGTECFTMVQKEGNYFIVADNLYYLPNENPELVEIPSFKRQNRFQDKPRGKFNPQKFAPYKPH